MKRIVILTIAAILSALPAFAGAQINDSEVKGNITDSLNSGSAYVGQGVILTNVYSTNGSGYVAGGKLYGSVTEVQRAGQGRPGKIALRFTKLVLPNGARYSVSGHPTSMQVDTKSNALKEAGGALLGMFAGNMIGKTLFQTGFGAAGAAGGFLLAKNNRQNVTIPANSVVIVYLASVRRQST